MKHCSICLVLPHSPSTAKQSLESRPTNTPRSHVFMAFFLHGVCLFTLLCNASGPAAGSAKRSTRQCDSALACRRATTQVAQSPVMAEPSTLYLYCAVDGLRLAALSRLGPPAGGEWAATFCIIGFSRASVPFCKVEGRQNAFCWVLCSWFDACAWPLTSPGTRRGGIEPQLDEYCMRRPACLNDAAVIVGAILLTCAFRKAAWPPLG